MNKIIPLFGLLLILLSGLLFAQFGLSAEEQKAQAVLKATASELGWPSELGPVQGAPGASYRISPEGAVSDPVQFAAIYVLASEKEALDTMNLLEDNGLTRATFNGRDGIVMHYGDQTCPKPGTQLAYTRDIIVGLLKMFLEAAFPDQELGDASSVCFGSYGTIAWRCDRYMFVVQDQTEAGMEGVIANTLYKHAEAQKLCSIGDTIIILADTGDVSGKKTIYDYQVMAQNINYYYSKNAYGRVGFTYTFKDADGSAGTNDWYRVGNSMGSFNIQNGDEDFAVKAVRAAFKDADMPEDVTVERMVIVYSGDSRQKSQTAVLSNQLMGPMEGAYVEVDAVQGKRKVYMKNIIWVSENSNIGSWVHEFGHSLYGKSDPNNFITDRYNYNNPARKYGSIGYWGLMGSGSHWGAKGGDAPPHMMSFTKWDANWLRYTTVITGKKYTETSLENKKMGEFILMLDDPQNTDGRFYYIIEARDSGVEFGAPESGVMIYKVDYDSANSHYVVNNIQTQAKDKTAIHSGVNMKYDRPTLYETSGNGSIYTDIPGEFRIVLESHSAKPYTATVRVEEYKPKNMKGVVAGGGDKPLVDFKKLGGGDVAGGAGTDIMENLIPGRMPDLDLHVYDVYGNHVGMNYDTWEYEVNIPGAVASGDLKDSPEWVFFPEGTQISRSYVSAEKAKLYLEDNPQLKQYAAEVKSSIEYLKFDADGNRYSASGGQASVGPYTTASIKSPGDGSLAYTPDSIPGFNNNEGAGGCCPAFIFMILLGGLLYAKLHTGL